MDYLPISKINTVTYCKRRYFIEMLLADTQNNYHLIEGEALHDRAVRPGENLWVWSDKLFIQGIIDQVKEENGETVITEIKKGSMSDYPSDKVQLCAQAICYEEVFSKNLNYGYIYYHKTRRKQKVDFTTELRQRVEQAVGEMRKIGNQDRYPAIVDNTNKCRGCSVKDVCQPKLSKTSKLGWKVSDI